MADLNDPRIYQALVLPEQALGGGGQEILRAGIIDDELYITALPAFENPGQWGEVLAEIARRLGGIYAAQTQGLSKKDATVAIVQAFAAEMGAREVKPNSPAKAKPRKAAKKSAKKPAKQPAKTSHKKRR
jgi:predicted metal-dependent phosphoesterase TrpH